MILTIFGCVLLVFICVALAVKHFGVDKTIVKYSPDLHGRVVVITGTTSGIGKQTAKRLSELGAFVILANRTPPQQAEQQAHSLSTQTGNPNIESVSLDLGNLQSCADCALEIKHKLSKLGLQHIDYLILNAGLMMCPLTPTAQGFEQHFGVNHLGHFVLTINLLPLLLHPTQQPTRIVSVSSLAHTFVNAMDLNSIKVEDYLKHHVSYSSTKAYGRSKLANILFAKELARRFPNQLNAFSLHPGNINSNIGRYFNKILLVLAEPFLWMLQKTDVEGAQTTLQCCLAPLNELENGGYHEDCHVSRANPIGNDLAAAKQLWETSLELTQSFITPESKKIIHDSN